MGDSLPPAWSRFLARNGFKPGQLARVLAPVCEQPGILRDFLEMPQPGEPPGDQRLVRLIFAARLIALRVRPRPAAWPDAGLALGLLLLMLAAQAGRDYSLTQGGELIRVPSAPLAHARATLTAAPPARVPCQAGTTG